MRLPFRKVWLLLLVLPVFFTACNFIQGGSGGTTSSCPQSGVYTLGLGQNDPGGSDWYIYSETASDPLALCQRTGAIITLVTNTSGYSLSLAHGGPGSQFVSIPAGTKVTNFNGLLVAGNWTAEIGGSQTDAPSGFSLQVAWKAP